MAFISLFHKKRRRRLLEILDKETSIIPKNIIIDKFFNKKENLELNNNIINKKNYK